MTGIDQSAVARVLGVDTQYKDFRGGRVLFLPQRLAVFAQGRTAATYSLAKWLATGADAVGARYGFGSPAHLIARELLPANGDGLGTIPVTFYPLEDDDDGEAAAGDITPSGTATKSGTYRVRAGGVLGEKFVIPAGAVNVTNVCVLIGDSIDAVLEIPIEKTYEYGTVTASALVGTGNGTLTVLTVTGTPRPGAWTLKVKTAVAHGGVWTLRDPDGEIAADDLTMTPGASTATVFNTAGLQFTLTDGSTDFGLNAEFTITVPATAVNVNAKWAGESGNDIVLEVIGDDVGVTFAFTQPTGGLVNPDIQAALNKVGNVWESMGLNALNVSDTDTLDTIQTWGEGRWGALVRKPMVVFCGNTATTKDDAVAVSDTRKTDRINGQLVAPGSVNLPFVVAARELARILPVANNNPPTDYGAQKATGLIPGDDGDQWDYVVRDQAVKAGSSTVEVVDGVVQISDVVTFYHPTGEQVPPYRFVCDIVKLQNILFNIDVIFSAAEWAAAPLIPNEQTTVNPKARKPKSAIAACQGMIDNLGLEAIISDPETAKAGVSALIDTQNPKRLNIKIPVQVSGNTNIKDVTLEWGFFFGQAVAA